MRYSVVTGDPNDFKDNGFTLRVVHHDPPRRAEFFIVMTMYNEDDTLFVRTMHGVMKSIGYLCKRDRKDHFAHAERDRGHRGLPGGHRDQRSQWQTTFRPYIRVYSLKDVEKDANLLFSVSFYAKVAVTEPNKIEGA
ncbi:hypothetical protein EDB86DRAFT_3079311 [Lactarius hatsudake]|nr:hypothetical protein EDB86DRAFT_3079311 [Lactarius hatsudake]